MIRFLTNLISMRMPGSRREVPNGPRQSQLLDGLPHMSARSQDFVRSSLAAWDSLDESKRHIPPRF
jgi:hypothetical protein